MKALRFRVNIPRYVLGLSLGKIFPSVFYNGLSCTYYDEIPDLDLPDENWVRIRTRYGGICGSDLGVIYLKASPYYSPLTSFPYTFGHENVGSIDRVGAKAIGWDIGDRVVVEPALWCQPRGFEDLCEFCARGEINRCMRITEGVLAPGLLTGACRDTGGSWSPYFLAHKSQLIRLPEIISDENALMVEPFAVGLHAALQILPVSNQRILLIGGGCIGLCTLAALRAFDADVDISVLIRYDFQREAAIRLGATRVFQAKGMTHFSEISEFYDARMLKPMLGKSVILGGADITFECAGSEDSLDEALRMTRNGGKVVVVGVPGIPKNVDWSAIFIHELDVRAAYIYNHAELVDGKRWKTFDLAIDLLASGKVDLSWMITHKFQLEDYQMAFRLLSRRADSGVIKAVFEFDRPSSLT